MKIGIITFSGTTNYGCVFQAYAMQKAIERLGAEPTTIYYLATHNEPSIFAPWSTYKNVIMNCFALLRYRKTRKRVEGFREFRSNYLKLSSEIFYSCEEIEGTVEEYDAFICGSDQIWCDLGNLDWTRAYYLDFVNRTEARKIAYAPSFGVSSISDEFKRTIKPLIGDIQYLSVREETGKRIIWETTGHEAEVVLDPTLLLDRKEWLDISSPSRIKPPYVLVYSLSQKPDLCRVVTHVKKKTALPVVVISAAPLNLIPGADHVLYDVCPREFIGLLSNAACVCTNSFHGTVFSIINRRPFWTTPHRATNSRIADMLHEIGLADRQLLDDDNLPESPLEIDYSKAGLVLDDARKKSISFLKNALFSI